MIIRIEKSLIFLLFVSLALWGALFLSPATVRAETVITVASATSLSNVLKEAAGSFEAATGVGVRFSFASTGVLASQIEHGAPFDLFIAADKRYADRLESDGLLLAASVKAIAEGALVIVVNRASGVKIKSIEELGGIDARLAIGNPAHVPYGTAAAEALRSAGVWKSMSKRLVYGENVRQALQFVESGNAAVGIVAESISLKLDERFYTIDVPRELHAPVVHAGGIVAGSINRLEAEAFLLFLSSPEVKGILRGNGFSAIK